MEVRLLGPVEVAVGGDVIRPSAAKVRALLAILALEANRPVSTDSLADRLWSGEPPPTAASVLRTYVSQLRKLLPDGAGRVERVGNGYQLRLGPEELDAGRFEAAIAAAKEPGRAKAEAVGLLRQALSVWRGSALVDLADDARAQAEAARLEGRRWEVVEALADIELDLGRHETVATDLEAAVQEAPLREQLVGQLMLALYRCGRQADALAAFQRLRRALVEELGLDPSSDLRRLETAILEQDPSLDAPVRRAGNLPATLTSFVGRQDQLDGLTEALAHERLVTLTGPGGCGKTRLALETADRSDDRADGVWFVELAARRNDDDVAPAVLGALGIDQRFDEDPRTTLRQALADRQLLLVLDNCEHLAGACAQLCASLLPAATGVTVLATSRSTLGVPGELIWPVPPLATPGPDDEQSSIPGSAAARLLAERIAAARGGRVPRPDEWPAIAALCRHLDGLPLAIELIGAKAATLSVTDLADEVGRQVLDAEGVTAGPEHHRSLAACIHWGLALLDDEHHRLLRRVCLLPGSFSANAAAAVAGLPDEADALAGLAHLAGQSLLQPLPSARSRFRVLETIRQVVRATVDDREAQGALDALTGWAAAWTESVEPSLRGPDAARLLDELEAEVEVLHAALEHGLSRPDPSDAIRIANAISALWAYRGYVVDGRRWLARAVSVSANVRPALRVRLLLASGTHHLTFGDIDGCRHDLDSALALARDSSEAPDVLRALLWAGHAVGLHGEHDTAAALYGEALDMARAAGDGASAASALAGLGDVAAAGDDLDRAASLHLRSLAEFRAVGDPHGEAQALVNIADVDRRAGRFSEAEARFDLAAEVFGSISDRSCMATSREGRARVAVDAGRLDDAERLFRGALDVRRELRQDRLVAATLVALAVVLAEAGRPLEAAAALGAAGEDTHPLAERLRYELGDRPYLAAWADGSLGRVAPPGG